MSKLMLIDAAHPEETRVAIATDGRVNDFDFETTGSEQLRGNIYLAKITRVEPSLQAAFVDYGGNRHGFLAFSEIHPDYYQLPQEDREALLREAAEEAAAAAEEDDEVIVDIDEDAGEEDLMDEADETDIEIGDIETDDDDEGEEEEETELSDESDEDTDEDSEDQDSGETGDSKKSKPGKKTRSKAASSARPRRKSRRPHLSRRYKIQEVIRRRQVLLVQVVKEERGNKGAALTTYLSLAGRYSVLMPNTPRGGGISRKIANGSDRQRLKKIVADLDVPQGMGLIVRTAGAKRTKAEIKRDYDYLSKLWETIVENTLSSDAPTLIKAEGGLVHRAMRDMFDKNIEEVLIHGEVAYREAKDLAKLLMPSQARKIKQWKDDAPLFVEEGIDEELSSIFSPTVQLKSGGYLVINQTEALVAIDVNSGKSTKERNIEQTALRTNLEAAEEACRQMRLRDLAGLIVIDFIDMDENRNNRAVEKKMKDCLRADRARVQYGRISQFGLMEISRQRRRQGVLQATSAPCKACDGTGRIRSIPSATLQLIRTIEARAAAGNLKAITVTAPTEVALHLLNQKREALINIETAAGFAISIQSSDDLLPGDFKIDAEKDPGKKARPKRKPRPPARKARNDSSDIEADETDPTEDTSGRGRRRRRGGRGRKKESAGTETETLDADNETAAGDDTANETPDASEDDAPKKRRRRGRRGGRRRKKGGADTEQSLAESGPRPDPVPLDGGAFLDGLSVSAAEMLDEAPPPEVKTQTVTDKETDAQISKAPEPDEAASKPKRRARKPKAKAVKSEVEEIQSAPEAPQEKPVSKSKPKPRSRAKAEPETVAAETQAASAETAPAEDMPAKKPAKPKRKGWWNRG